MKLFFQRWWPFCWKSSLEDAWRAQRISHAAAEEASRRMNVERQRAEKAERELQAATLRAEDLDAQMVRMQAHYEDFMRAAMGPAWSDLARKCFRQVRDGSVTFAAVTKIHSSMDADAYGDRCHQKDYQLVRMSFDMALGETCPPELVAEELGQKVRAEVLRRWREQSLLVQGR